MSLIKTPDHRLRVFISSTIQELSEERKAIRLVLEQMMLTPVFFESGARPHPPRDLYHSYLEQSDIFVGIYWKSYGWIAPDMEVSGIEDEWQLSERLPKLIYIKQSDIRDPRLDLMLNKIRNSNTTSYQNFINPEELHRLVANDLAILLSERFQSIEEKPSVQNKKPKTNLPILRNKFIGREQEMADILEKLKSETLISLVGAGGTGKSRLALEIGCKLIGNFDDGVFFVRLETISDPARVPGAILHTLGITNQSTDDDATTLQEYLFDKKMMLIFDNLEQVIDAGIFISHLISSCPFIKCICTSRTPLYIRSEVIYNLEPLVVTPTDLSGEFSSAVKLFMERANDANSKINWTQENLMATYNICQKIDGLPLAIELAAARCRHMSPEQLFAKMQKVLDTLPSGPRDYPERQKTLRNTILWSYNLLDDQDKRLFRRLGVFKGGWTFEALDAICWKKFSEKGDWDLVLERLKDLGLVRNNLGDGRLDSMLHIIREFAVEEMQTAGEYEKIREYHCQYYLNYCLENLNALWFTNPEKEQMELMQERENLMEALQYSLEKGDLRTARGLITGLNILYLISAELSHLEDWMEEAHIKSNPENIQNLLKEHDKIELAIFFMAAGFTRTLTGNIEEGIRDLQTGIQFSQDVDNIYISLFCHLFLAPAWQNIGEIEKAEEVILKGLSINKEIKNVQAEGSLLVNLGVVKTSQHKTEEAKKLLFEALQRVRTTFSPIVEEFGLYALGYLFYSINDFEESFNYFKQAEEVYNKYKINLNVSYTFIGIALTLLETGNSSEAKEYLQKALQTIRTTGNKMQLVCYMIALSTYYAKTNQADKCLTLFVHNQTTSSKLKLIKPWIGFKMAGDKTEAYLNKQFEHQTIQKALREYLPYTNEQIYSLEL